MLYTDDRRNKKQTQAKIWFPHDGFNFKTDRLLTDFTIRILLNSMLEVKPTAVDRAANPALKCNKIQF